MTPLPAPLRWLYSLEWRRGLFDWARSDGVTWVYIFKVLLAAFLTLWLAMRLELPQPRTAMITVFIVMQPQSGHVFAKSFYRVLGTLAGSAMMVALIAMAVFGGTGPMIATWLANRGITFTMTAYFLALSATATVAAWRMKETAFSPLRR